MTTTVPLETLHAIGFLPERCIDCDSRRCDGDNCPARPAPIAPAVKIANEYMETIFTLGTRQLREDYAMWLTTRRAAHAQGLTTVVTAADRVLAEIVRAGAVRTAPGAVLRRTVVRGNW